jgi:hypothetical protein
MGRHGATVMPCGEGKVVSAPVAGDVPNNLNPTVLLACQDEHPGAFTPGHDALGERVHTPRCAGCAFDGDPVDGALVPFHLRAGFSIDLLGRVGGVVLVP